MTKLRLGTVLHRWPGGRASSTGLAAERCAALNRAAVNVASLIASGTQDDSEEAIRQVALVGPLLPAQFPTAETIAPVDALIDAHGNPSGLR
jgi:hypothetical protein